ncbi:MAG: ATP-binding protein [Rhodocyclaceae bacterium]
MSVTWPRTLLWRTFLLIVLLIGLSLYAWFQIYTHYALRPRARQTAQMVVSVVNLTRSALVASDASQRTALLQELTSLEGIRIYPAEQSDPIVPLSDSDLMRTLEEELHQRLGSYTRLTSRFAGRQGFFVSFRLQDDDPNDEYWVMLPSERIERTGAAEWIGWGVAAGALSLLGAYLLVLGVTRPLKALENAARAIGRGETPAAVLSESGPSEVVAVAQAFNQMSSDLTQLESDRALILAGVSHDLRTPLARLRLGVELSGGSSEDREAMVGDIEEMDRIINQFLDFARGSNAEAPQQVMLDNFLTDIVAPYQRRGRTVRLESPKVEIDARPMALRRAVTNLIDNALRYAGMEQPIDIAVTSQHGMVWIDVADRGPGIPPEHAERLKRPFTQLETARTDAQGSGLGLAIVDRIARTHGGHLELLPRQGGGLLARIILPV